MCVSHKPVVIPSGGDFCSSKKIWVKRLKNISEEPHLRQKLAETGLFRTYVSEIINHQAKKR